MHEGGGAHKTALKTDGEQQYSIGGRRQGINIDELLTGCLGVISSRKIHITKHTAAI